MEKSQGKSICSLFSHPDCSPGGHAWSLPSGGPLQGRVSGQGCLGQARQAVPGPVRHCGHPALRAPRGSSAADALPAGRRASTPRARSPPRHRRLAVPHGSPTGRRGPFPEESCRPPASRAKGSRVSALVYARRPRAGPRPAALTSSWHGPPRPQQIALGSQPAGCVIRQPELRRSALGCASVFSSNCSMARSARKIFQNKAVDGNCISTWGAEGMCAVGAWLGTPLRQTDAHHRGGPGRACV